MKGHYDAMMHDSLRNEFIFENVLKLLSLIYYRLIKIVQLKSFNSHMDNNDISGIINKNIL